MSQVKILFDECLSKSMMEDLGKRVPSGPQLAHVCDFFAAGTPDNVWIPKISEEGWIVITTDGGKKGTRGGKLPQLCAQFKITHVVFSHTLHNRKGHEKLAALLLVWEEIEKLPARPKGSRFTLRYKAIKHRPGLRIVLESPDARH